MSEREKLQELYASIDVIITDLQRQMKLIGLLSELTEDDLLLGKGVISSIMESKLTSTVGAIQTMVLKGK